MLFYSNISLIYILAKETYHPYFRYFFFFFEVGGVYSHLDFVCIHNST